MKFEKYNANPMNHETGDCSIRALSKGLDQSYDVTLSEACDYMKMTYKFIAFKDGFIGYLEKKGFIGKTQKIKKGDKRLKVKDFTKGTYILQVANHWTCVKDGTLYDLWDCRNKAVYRYWEIVQ